jgi:hypothetical protein
MLTGRSVETRLAYEYRLLDGMPVHEEIGHRGLMQGEAGHLSLVAANETRSENTLRHPTQAPHI